MAESMDPFVAVSDGSGMPFVAVAGVGGGATGACAGAVEMVGVTVGAAASLSSWSFSIAKSLLMNQQQRFT